MNRSLFGGFRIAVADRIENGDMLLGCRRRPAFLDERRVRQQRNRLLKVFDRLAQMRGLDVVTFSDWKKIEEAEEAAARAGSPREKFVDIESMIAARRT